MKFRLPSDCLGVCVDGRPSARGADGTIDVEPHLATALAPHGILALPEAEAREAVRAKAAKDKSPAKDKTP